MHSSLHLLSASFYLPLGFTNFLSSSCGSPQLTSLLLIHFVSSLCLLNFLLHCAPFIIALCFLVSFVLFSCSYGCIVSLKMIYCGITLIHMHLWSRYNIHFIIQCKYHPSHLADNCCLHNVISICRLFLSIAHSSYSFSFSFSFSLLYYIYNGSIHFTVHYFILTAFTFSTLRISHLSLFCLFFPHSSRALFSPLLSLPLVHIVSMQSSTMNHSPWAIFLFSWSSIIPAALVSSLSLSLSLVRLPGHTCTATSPPFYLTVLLLLSSSPPVSLILHLQLCVRWFHKVIFTSWR